MEFFLNIFSQATAFEVYSIMFLLLLACGLGLPLPEDITLITAGYIAYLGTINVLIAVLVGLTGVIIGDCFMYFLGSKLGMKIFSVPILRKLFTQKRILKAQDILKKHGTKFIFTARFLPGLRSPIFFTCGTLSVPFKKFIFWDGLAAIISVPTLVFLAYYGGTYIDTILKYVRRAEYGLVFIVLSLAAFFVIKHYYFDKRKNVDNKKKVISEKNELCKEGRP